MKKSKTDGVTPSRNSGALKSIQSTMKQNSVAPQKRLRQVTQGSVSGAAPTGNPFGPLAGLVKSALRSR